MTYQSIVPTDFSTDNIPGIILILLLIAGGVYLLWNSVKPKKEEKEIKEEKDYIEGTVAKEVDEYGKSYACLSHCCGDLALEDRDKYTGYKCHSCYNACRKVTREETRPHEKLMRNKEEFKKSNSDLPFHTWLIQKEEDELTKNMSFTEWLTHKSKNWNPERRDPPV